MRKFSMVLLLAATAAPALAAPDEEGERQGRRQAQEQSDNRPQRAERPERAERQQQRSEAREQMQAQRQVQVERQMQAQQQSQVQPQQIQQQQQVERQRGQRDGALSRMRDRGQQSEQGQQSRDERMQQYRQQMEQRQALEGRQSGQSGGLVERQGRYRSVPNINPNAGQPAPVNRDGRFAGHRDRRDRPQWVSNWRNDNRYDWRRHRDRHRSTFHIGFYFDPFGYSYRRFGLGSYLYPSYYQSNYWINDPWQYRLPAAYGSYRWVRYHNDALLIDTWNGEVVDVIYGFFW